VAGTNIHACIGIGGAPEGVLTAAAIKCLNGEIQARLVYDPERLGVDKDKVPPEEEVLARLKEMGYFPTKVVEAEKPKEKGGDKKKAAQTGSPGARGKKKMNLNFAIPGLGGHSSLVSIGDLLMAAGVAWLIIRCSQRAPALTPAYTSSPSK